LHQATAQTQTILATARALLSGAQSSITSRGLTLIGVALSNLDDDRAIQLALPFDRRSASAVDAVIDRVRNRFGSAAITRAVLLGHNHDDMWVPLLPD
jgi:DNA polymerase-4